MSLIQERMDKQDEAIDYLKAQILALKVNSQADHNKILHVGKEVRNQRDVYLVDWDSMLVFAI